MFSTAGRTVKSGLVASAVVLSWTWAATLLQSSGVAYRYGVSGPFWYASGMCSYLSSAHQISSANQMLSTSEKHRSRFFSESREEEVLSIIYGDGNICSA